MSDNSWRFESKCAGRIAEFSVDALGKGEKADAKARRLCAGCTTFIQCAEDIYDHPDHNGVVGAGRVIRATKSGLTEDEIRRELADLLDVEFVSAKDAHKAQLQRQKTKCASCGCLTVSPKEYAENHPDGTLPRWGKGMCVRCYRKEQRADKKVKVNA